MPLCPQITNTPIPVVLNSDFTVTSVIPVLPATTTQVNVALADATAAQAAAATALAQANTAYTAAIGSLQPSANTIVNASNQITAINGTGITVYSGASATSGARVVLNSTGLAGFNSGGTATFSVSASTGAAVFAGDVTGSIITGATLNIGGNAIINSSGFLTATGATITGNITATSGSFTGSIYASTGTIGGFTIGATNIQSGSLDIQSGGSIVGGNSSYLYYGYVNIGGGTAGSERLIVTGNSNFNGTIISSSSITAQGELYAVFGGSNTVTNTANTWISSGGQIRRTTASSLRYKENVTDLVNVDELNPKRLLDLPVRAFTYKQEYLAASDDRYQQIFPGFISEEVDAIYPMAADYENGQVESWNDRLLLPGMLALIQDLYKEIATLKGE
jgi:hypothetical protein